jgi:hypothetical protein
MLSVIKFNVEAFIKLRRKTFQRRIAAVDVPMTDDTHGHGGSYKLPGMATDAGFVSWKYRGRRIVSALMTRSAGEGSVTLTRVLET